MIDKPQKQIKVRRSFKPKVKKVVQSTLIKPTLPEQFKLKVKKFKKENLEYKELVLPDGSLFFGYCFKRQLTGYGSIKFVDEFVFFIFCFPFPNNSLFFPIVKISFLKPYDLTHSSNDMQKYELWASYLHNTTHHKNYRIIILLHNMHNIVVITSIINII